MVGPRRDARLGRSSRASAPACCLPQSQSKANAVRRAIRRFPIVHCGSRTGDGTDACSRAEASAIVSRLTPHDRHTPPNQSYCAPCAAWPRSPCSARRACRWRFPLRQRGRGNESGESREQGTGRGRSQASFHEADGSGPANAAKAARATRSRRGSRRAPLHVEIGLRLLELAEQDATVSPHEPRQATLPAHHARIRRACCPTSSGRARRPARLTQSRHPVRAHRSAVRGCSSNVAGDELRGDGLGPKQCTVPRRLDLPPPRRRVGAGRAP